MEDRKTVMLKCVDREVGMVGYKCAACGAEFVQLDPPAACILCGRETERVEEMGEVEG